MNWQTRIGYRVLFWIAESTLSDSLSDEQRGALHAIVISFSNDSLPKLELKAL